MTQRDVIIGPPRSGKTTLALEFARPGVRVMHTDSLIGSHAWSELSLLVARDWLTQPGPWIIEGVAAVRALRKWLHMHSRGKPCDRVIELMRPREKLTARQRSMAKGCATIWADVRPGLAARGVALEHRGLAD